METGASKHLSGWRTYAFPYVIIFLAALLALAWQFIFPGIYQSSNDDAAIMFKYVPQFAQSYRQGIFYPRWMPDDFSGYGAPVFVFYSPLLYAVSGFLSLTGLDIVFIKTTVELLRLYAGGVFLFLLLKESHGPRAGLAAALFYTLLPARIVDLYYLATPATRLAQAFMPMALYFTRKYVTRPQSRLNLLAMSLSYAAIVLSHIATAFLFTPFLLAYGFFGAGGKAGAKSALKTVAGTGMGLLLCSFFFVPVLFERGLVQMEFMGRFYYGDYFLFTPGASFPGQGVRLRSLITNAVLAEACLLGVALYFAWRFAKLQLDREGRFYLAAVMSCLFMMSFLSAPLWEHVPGLKTVQFPIRYEPIDLLFIPALLGAATPSLLRIGKWPKVVTALALVLAAGLFAYDARLVAASTPYSAGEAVKEAAYIRFPEYLPRTTRPQAMDGLGRDDPLVFSADGLTEVKNWGAADRSFLVDSARGTKLRVKTFYFPGWRARVDGKEVPLRAQEGTGAILIDVPPGRHDVRLEFTDTPLRAIGEALSLLTLAAFIFPYGRLRRSR
jgi:hypothetical protein